VQISSQTAVFVHVLVQLAHVAVLKQAILQCTVRHTALRKVTSAVDATKEEESGSVLDAVKETSVLAAMRINAKYQSLPEEQNRCSITVLQEQ